MNVKQEPKYKAENGQIVNRASGEAIPEDEPVFIFRARDMFAESALRYYLRYLKKGTDHHTAVSKRVDDFEAFYESNRARMKVPDTEINS